MLTAATDRDICLHYKFTADDRYIIYLREVDHGSELYHLYCLDIRAQLVACVPVQSGLDLLAAHPRTTCCVGFVGMLQLWLPRDDPDTVVLSTGGGSLLWSLSSLSLSTGELTTVFANPASTRLGIARLVLALVLHVVVACVCRLLSSLTLGLAAPLLRAIERLAPAPAAPSQYFVDRSGDIVGFASATFGIDGIALRFTKRLRAGGWAPACPDLPFARLNMQLVGSGPASGTLRMERLEGDAIALHTCEVSDTTAYVRYDRADAPPVVLAHDARGDIDGWVVSPVSGELEAVVVTAERSELVPVSSGGRRLAAELRRFRERLGGADDESLEVLIASRTLEDDVWVVRTASDTDAATYYLHSPGRGCSPPPLELLCARPKLRSLPLSPTAALRIRARDGESLPAYLTRPRGASADAKLPLALVLHGGPNARDFGGYSPQVQLLAARGIAVLRLNYRGSTGFGTRFYGLGVGNVRGMHEDVEDARRWAVESGLADPRRIAIVGGSWGGYLALGGATKIAGGQEAGGEEAEGEEAGEEEAGEGESAPRYAAVVAIVPVVAVLTVLRSFRGDPLAKQYWKQLLGPAVTKSASAAAALSPLHRLERLDAQTKLLLAHGERDPRVPRSESDAVAATVQRMGIRGVHLVYAREGHSISREPNVLHLWSTIERFLCRALGTAEGGEVEGGMEEKHTCAVHWDDVLG